MRKLLLALLVCASALAQIPTDTMRAKLAERLNAYRDFVAAHPDAQIVKRIEEAIHFRMNDGKYTALFGEALSYVDPDTRDLTPIALDLYQTDAGYRTVGSPITIRVIDGPLINGNPTTEVDTYRKDPNNGSVVGYGIAIAPATLNHDTVFRFNQNGIPWEIDLQEFGWDLRARVPATKGAATYRFGYREVNMALDPDADGNLATPGGVYKISRPLMMRADGVVTPCGGWQKNVAGNIISFTCDDTAFPPSAYPYVIDPTASFNIATSGSGNMWGFMSGNRTAGCCPEWDSGFGSTFSKYIYNFTGYGAYGPRAGIINVWQYQDNGDGTYTALVDQDAWSSYIKFNTSSLAGKTITGAALYGTVSVSKDYELSYGGSPCYFGIGWEPYSVWSAPSQFFLSSTASITTQILTPNAYAWKHITDIAHGVQTLTLSNAPANVSTSGWTTIATSVYCTGSPVFNNIGEPNQWTAYDVVDLINNSSAGTPVVLQVTYAGGAKLIMVNQ